MTARVNVVLNRTLFLLTATNVSTTCAVVIFRVKVSCISSVCRLVVDLISQRRRNVIGRL